MKSITILILTILLFGCTQKKKKEVPAFASIDYSLFVGYYQSIKILSDGTTYISDSSDFSCTKYYSIKFEKSELDTLSKMTQKLASLKLDSSYFAPICDHPISFCLIIKTNERTISTYYFGDQNESEWNTLFHLTDYLASQGKKMMEHYNSAVKFESKSRLHGPPPRGK